MTTSPAINNPTISRGRAEFLDPQLELAYQQHVLADTVQFLRFSLWLWAALLIAAIPMDFGALSSAESIVVITSVRLTHVILLRQSEAANQSLEIEIARRQALEAELQRRALTDPLTGLSNRRHCEMLFIREHERCRRHHSVLTSGKIDFDHFKRITDTYGHEFGDRVLQFAAEILQRPLRHMDILGRFGGEEFIKILPDTGIAQAQAVAERMRQLLEQEIVKVNVITETVTATIALTHVRATDPNIQECIRRADQALYQGKHAARNRVALADAA